MGWVGYWERSWREEEAREIGWAVLPPFQGRGVAVAATARVIAEIRAADQRRFLHAFPSVVNAHVAAGSFELLGEIEFEDPPGNLMWCNDWRLDLAS